MFGGEGGGGGGGGGWSLFLSTYIPQLRSTFLAENKEGTLFPMT